MPDGITCCPRTFGTWPGPVLGHRIFSGGGARAQEAELLLDRMIGEIPVPLEKK